LIEHDIQTCYKYIDIKFNAHERFWNNIHQVAQDQKIGKPNNLIVLGTQYLWVLMDRKEEGLRVVGNEGRVKCGKGEG
jgi:hypothetical protein